MARLRRPCSKGPKGAVTGWGPLWRRPMSLKAAFGRLGNASGDENGSRGRVGDARPGIAGCGLPISGRLLHLIKSYCQSLSGPCEERTRRITESP